jgi:glycosyltransferase involved in cell wall biosynthesis
MAYNEANSLAGVVREIRSSLEEMGRTYEIIILDDGSTDSTAAIADQLVAEYPHLHAVHHAENLGLGSVYRHGFSESKGEYLTFFPADGQFPADILKQFFPLTAQADLVLGYLPRQDSSLLARFLSFSEKLLYYLLFGPLPPFKGVMLIRRSILEEIELKSQGRGWGVVMELIIRASRGRFRIISVPTEIRPRLSGKSKVRNPTTILANFKQVIALRFYL